MKPKTNPTRFAFLLFTITGLLLAACDAPLTGPDLDTTAPSNQDRFAGKTATTRQADLSVQLRVDTISGVPLDSVIYFVDLHNDGPDVATGVQLAFHSEIPCAASDGGSRDIEDIIIWDIVDSVVPGESQTYEVTCPVSGPGSFVSTAEVMASDARDPDSTPGNGNPDEDDYDSLTLSPGEPLCIDCPN